MDEVEFRVMYNAACDATQQIGGPETKKAINLMLQMMQGLFEMIQDMQLDEDDDE